MKMYVIEMSFRSSALTGLLIIKIIIFNSDIVKPINITLEKSKLLNS